MKQIKIEDSVVHTAQMLSPQLFLFLAQILDKYDDKSSISVSENNIKMTLYKDGKYFTETVDLSLAERYIGNSTGFCKEVI